MYARIKKVITNHNMWPIFGTNVSLRLQSRCCCYDEGCAQDRTVTTITNVIVFPTYITAIHPIVIQSCSLSVKL